MNTHPAPLHQAASAHPPHDSFRVATYNIHKGVQGLGPMQRLEIHNLLHAVEQFDADLVCLQEVRLLHQRGQARFSQWPVQGQAHYLTPEGYQAIYHSNAVSPHNEHGNALLSRWPVVAHRHEDMSDHRFERRGLLHGEIAVEQRRVHIIVVHLGLIAASRTRQVAQLLRYIAREVPPNAPLLVAGDFNDWGKRCQQAMQTALLLPQPLVQPTFPARLPLAQLDQVYARGLRPLGSQVPRGRNWWRMSDHLPLISDWAFAT